MISLICMLIFFIVLIFLYCTTPMYSAALLILTVLLSFLLLVVSHSALFSSYLPFIFLIVYVGAIIVVIGYVCSITPLVVSSNSVHIYLFLGFSGLFFILLFLLKFDPYWNSLNSNTPLSQFSPSDFIFHPSFIFFFALILLLLLFLLLISSSSVPAQSTLRSVSA